MQPLTTQIFCNTDSDTKDFMANTLQNNQVFFIQGDGSSTSITIPLGYTPTSVIFVSANETTLGLDVSANVSSTSFNSNSLTVNFVAPFSYLITLVLTLLPFPAPSAISILNFPATQPISGTVSANQSNMYRACTFNYVPTGSGTQPFFSLQGSATKTIRIVRILFSIGYTTGLIGGTLLLLQRFSVLSGGTPAIMTAGTNDTSNPAATAVASTWSPLPTTATEVGGALSIMKYNLPTETAAINAALPYEWTFGQPNEQNITLRGTSDYLGLMMLNVPTAPLVTLTVEWTES
jgi:hypothetical protein